MNTITPHALTDCQAYGRRRSSSSVAGWFVRIAGLWRARAQERQAFARLEYRELRDLGVSRWEVERELARPFWRG
jgi:uncharacterized protein YjiS (DUF1127 family)